MMNNEAIVSSIKQLCKDNNITVTQLEKEVGMSQGLVSKWKDKVPSLDKIIDIADYFHVTLDEVVGRNQLTDDAFINKLIELTENEIIIWHPYSDNNSNVKEFCQSMDANEFFSMDDYRDYCETHFETSYYAIFNEGYISIYSSHLKHKTDKPYDVKLFIQANKDTELVQEDCTTEQLLPLWLKVLVSLKEGKPDDLQATELKQQIMLSNKKPIKIKLNKPNIVANKTEVERLLEKYGDTQLSQLIITFSQPEMAKTIKAANTIVDYLDNNGEVDVGMAIEKLKKHVNNNKRAGD